MVSQKHVNDSLVFIPGSEGVVEIELLLPVWQAAVLEETACQRGITVGQLVRQLVRDFVARSTESSE